MNKAILLALIFLVLPLASASQLSPDLERLLPLFKANDTLPVLILANQTTDFKEVKELSDPKYTYSILNAIAITLTRKQIESLNLSYIYQIQPDYKTEIFLDKSRKLILADQIASTGQGVKTALIDTGIDEAEPTISGHVLSVVKDSGKDESGHGTQLANILISRDEQLKGIAPKAELFSIKATDDLGLGRMSDAIAALEKAIEKESDIILFGIGTRFDKCDGKDALSLAADLASLKYRKVVIAPAGNDGPTLKSIASPACGERVIAVGSVNNDKKIAGTSSRGPRADDLTKPDIVAPGVYIKTKSKGEIIEASGTSLAAAHVAGVVALMLKENPYLRPEDTASILKESATDLGYESDKQGSGLINSKEAVKRAQMSLIRPPRLEPREVTLPAPGILPGSFFFSFDRFFEDLDIKLARTHYMRAQFLLDTAEERLAEAKLLSTIGEENMTITAINLHDEKFKACWDEADKIEDVKQETSMRLVLKEKEKDFAWVKDKIYNILSKKIFKRYGVSSRVVNFSSEE